MSEDNWAVTVKTGMRRKGETGPSITHARPLIKRSSLDQASGKVCRMI